MPSQMISEQLGATGLCVWPNFLSPESLAHTREDLEQIRQAGGFHRAGTGQGSAQSVQDLRRDNIHWLNRRESNPVQDDLWRKLDSLQQSLNRNLFLGIQEFEGHYASYPEGGFYRRHRDSFEHDDSRVVSLVLYLNQAWSSEHGGRLRIHGNNSHRDIDPVGGTMVCFFSRESEHEVLESRSPRNSFTGWFKTRLRKA